MPEQNESASSMTNVLIIDDENQIRKFLDIALRAQGYKTLLAENGQKGLELLALQGADLVILDLGLPDLDGYEVLSELRTWSHVPVIVLSVRANEEEKVKLLDAGANDYVTKPFSVQELVARIRVLLRQHQHSTVDTVIFDDGVLKIDFSKRQVFLNQQLLSLTRKEYQLLNLLAKNKGQLITQPQILKELWGPTHQEDTHYLRILVAKLRVKLNDNAVQPKYIITEPGVGLRFLKIY
ncbi:MULTISPECIES: response regulator [Acinetobacter]|jgi:two-component system KDP operon response regulator KdpE|uniref:KdpE n=4 Tax=Acinetobacter TaxID=469 RepID=A0A380UAU4_ACIJO|nr:MULTISPECIES: response regulator [Acinetobacter]MDN5441953.1 response regulator [Acinetobacter sp.]MDN5444707.1 response regulator [Pseudomonadales bacterium]AWA48847.1 response regulator [Acinetobacter junii]EEY91898.1 KDP operon transcriptional regulatory protein KdpE [Acinetobacter junii SH205]EEY95966.1 KDP operon transcriptional regulatory protein KdpE [Acinetobacter johnsonii SH046]